MFGRLLVRSSERNASETTVSASLGLSIVKHTPIHLKRSQVNTLYLVCLLCTQTEMEIQKVVVQGKLHAGTNSGQTAAP